MSFADVQNGIENRANTNLRIGENLTDIIEFLIKNGYIPGGPAVKTPDLCERCPQASYSRVTRLYKEMGMVNKFSQGPDTYLIHARKDEIVNGQEVSAMVNEELRRILEHAKRDLDIRRCVATAQGKPPSMAFRGLFNGDFGERRGRLERTVHEIQREPRAIQGDYDKIVFKKPANLYRATPLAVQLYNK